MYCEAYEALQHMMAKPTILNVVIATSNSKVDINLLGQYNKLIYSLNEKKVVYSVESCKPLVQALNYLNNKDDIITRTDLRNLNYVNGTKFKRFFDEHFEEVKEELESSYNLLLYPYEGKGNVRAYQCIKK